MRIRQTTLNGCLPVLQIESLYPQIAKLFGVIPQQEKNIYLFPFFPPFRDLVAEGLLNHIQQHEPDERAETVIKTGLENGEEFQTVWENVAAQAFPVKSMVHQLQGTAELLYNYRWALQWEMGTGKSKVAIDALSLLQEPALILCPLVALNNWKNEIDKHSGGKLKVLLLDGKSTKEKKKQLRESAGYDVYVSTYDNARLYGVPTLYPETVRLFEKAHMVPNVKLRDALKNLNDKEQQLQFAEQLVQLRPTSEVLADLLKITQENPTCLEHLPYKIIIPDESHRIKRIQSKRTQFCLQLSAKAYRRWLLTGTMSLGDPRDLYTQLRFLAPYLMPENWITFCKNHLVYRPGSKHIVVQYKNIDVINKRTTLISSTKKLNDCVDLPERRFVTLNYDFTREQTINYDRAARDFEILRTNDNDIYQIAHSANAVSKLLQICSGFVYVPPSPDDTKLLDSQDMHSPLNSAVTPEVQRLPVNNKLNLLMDQLDDLVNGQGGKVIIWANYIAELDDVERALKNANIEYVRVDGSTSSRIQERVNRFQTDPKCSVYLAQEKTGIAITLTAANYMIYYSRSWSLEDDQQSLFRNYRIGQTKKTVVYYLVARDTIEDQQRLALENKQDIAELLTQRTQCVMCSSYGLCVVNGTKPWDDGCVLEKNPHRVVTKPTPLTEEEEDDEGEERDATDAREE